MKKIQLRKNIQKLPMIKKMNKIDDQNTITGHLTELRSRLIKSLIFIFVIFIFGYFFAEYIYSFLLEPYAKAVRNDGIERRLIFTALHETFITYLKLAFFLALFLGSPIFLTQMWKLLHLDFTKMKKKRFYLILSRPQYFFY